MSANNPAHLRAAQANDEQALLARALEHFRPRIEAQMQAVLAEVDTDPLLHDFYGQMAYHLGWVDQHFQPASLPPGKFLRPALVLWAAALAAEASGADAAIHALRVDQALPVAAAVEFLHNFSLIHDDIEDRDLLRRHRPTLWSLWGEAQGINTGDGLFCVMRLALWGTLRVGVTPHLAAQLAILFDRTALTLCEGQHRDMAFEARATVTVSAYLDMIRRKTAALMRASAQAGALIGSPSQPELATFLATFGEALGMAFQIRDDILGIWEADHTLGKSAAGDLRRKKMSLPVIHTLAEASPAARAHFHAIYAQPGAASEAEIATLLTIIEETQARRWCQLLLAEHCDQATAALQHASAGTKQEGTSAALLALGALIEFVRRAAQA